MLDEIKNSRDAMIRLQTFYGRGSNALPEDCRYAFSQLLGLLAKPDRFEKALEKLSKAIWVAYNDPSIIQAPNRYTLAITSVANPLGFNNTDLVVLTSAAPPNAFGTLLGNRMLWKDSFALGHGEFAHSYQWLAAGIELYWGAKTAVYYQATKGRLSYMPCWVKDDDSPDLKLRPARLWEYLVDCTQWDGKKMPKLAAAMAWVEQAFAVICQEKPTSWNNGHRWLESVLLGEQDVIVRPLRKPLITKLEFEEMRARYESDALRVAFFRDKLAVVAQRIVDLFPIACALTKSTQDGGAFRNANNVTALARKARAPNWFITAYENRRQRKLMTGQNSRLIEEVALKLSQRGTVIPSDSLRYSLVLNNQGVGDFIARPTGSQIIGFIRQLRTTPNLDVANPRTITNAAFAFLVLHQAGGARVGAKKLAERNPRYFPSAMDALTKDRQSNYTNRVGWSGAGIYRKTISPSQTLKTQHVSTYHDVDGDAYIPQF